MERLRRVLVLLALVVGMVQTAAASQRLMLFEYFSNTG
jgi:hypothetical protein